MSERILLDIKLETFLGPTAEAPRTFCITFIFPKINSQVKWWIKSRITASQFIYELSEFTASAISKLLLNAIEYKE
jgi:hypothetical protein